MIGWIFRKLSWKTFAAGAATALVGEAVARPVMVSVFKAGIGVQSAVAGAYQKARNEVGNLYHEAKQTQS